LILYLDDQGRSHDDSAGDHDDEYGRPVARIGKAEIQAALFASGFQSQEPLKQLSLAATRTSTQKASGVRRWFFREILVQKLYLWLSAFRLGDS